MGRNNDTFTLVVERNKDAWSKFRRGLRKEDQQLFDELWRAPKLHLAAGAFIANEVPLETILMAMILELHKKVRSLEKMLGRDGPEIWKTGVMLPQPEPGQSGCAGDR